MDKQKIIAFFDRLADRWDEEAVENPAIINAILDHAAIEEGVTVLDVACGTGILFPYYLERMVARVTGVDISPRMIARAREKFSDPRIELVNADVEEALFPRPFDRCVVYNSFPHFSRPARLIAVLARQLAPSGRLTIAHGESRAKIDERHRNHASEVSRPLLPEDELAALLEPYFAVDVIISNEQMFVVSGTKKIPAEVKRGNS